MALEASDPILSAPPAVDDEPPEPASGSGRLDEEVHPIAVRVPPWRRRGGEGDRQHAIGMASLASGSAGRSGESYRSFRPPIQCRIGPGFPYTFWPGSVRGIEL